MSAPTGASPPRARLRAAMRRVDYMRASRVGRRVAARYFLILLVERGDRGAPRLGITVTRKVGNAVRRNRIKRLVREWFRRHSEPLQGMDLNVIAKREIPPALQLGDVVGDLDAALARWKRP